MAGNSFQRLRAYPDQSSVACGEFFGLRVPHVAGLSGDGGLWRYTNYSMKLNHWHIIVFGRRHAYMGVLCYKVLRI